MLVTNPKIEIKRSNHFMDGIYEMSFDNFRLFLVAANKLKNQLQNNIETSDAFKVVITKEQLEKIFPTFLKDKNIQKRLHHMALEFKNHNSIAIPMKTDSDSIKYQFIQILKSIEYKKNSHLFEMCFDEKIREHINPKDNFNITFAENIAELTSKYQTKIYDFCTKYPYPQKGERTITLKELRNSFGLKDNQYKRTNHLIERIIRYSVNKINEKSDINLEFKPIKTGRIITAIKFFIETKNKFLLDDQSINLKTQLCQLKLNPKKIDSLIKHYSAEVLISTINTVNNSKKDIKNTTAYFFGVLSNKIVNQEDLDIIQISNLFKENLTIKDRHLVWNEFYNQLEKDKKETYSNAFRSSNKIVKNALTQEFDKELNIWIYHNKIKKQEKETIT